MRAHRLSVALGMNRKQLLLGIISLGLVVFVACGTSQTAGSSSSSGGATSDLKTASDFQFTLYQGDQILGGNELSLADLRGKPLVLNFWAGLCPPCRAEMPDLQEVYEEFGDRIVLFGLDVGVFTFLGTREEGRELLQELEVTYPAGSTLEGFAVRAYEVLGMPTTVFMTPNGEVMRTWSGLLTKDKMVDIVQQLLAVS